MQFKAKSKWILFLYLILPLFLGSFTNSQHPFDYDLHLCTIPGTNGKTLICMHGKGGDYTIAYNVKEHAGIGDTIVSFNFPDYGIRSGQCSLDEISYGTINELLPALYVLKKLIIDEGQTEINLYGFSAGGGALINTIGALNSYTYDTQLKKIGIQQKEKEKILTVIQKGNIILDTPLKSVREIVAFRGPECELVPFEKRYRENNFEPIDSLQGLDNLSLNIWVHFQNPDEVLSNRDDDLYIQRLKKYNNRGKTTVILGFDNGHRLPHKTLWKIYSQENRMYSLERQEPKYIIGIKTRTSNKDHREDITLLWNRFRKDRISDKISNKINGNIYAVYTDYEKDFSRPYTYTVGCEVANLDNIPDGMYGVIIEPREYAVISAKGPFPKSIIQAWQKIWQSSMDRAYQTDFEVYPSDFNWDNSLGLKIYVGVK